MKRFKDNKDGTVLDNQTGLIWLKDASLMGKATWENANNACKKVQNSGKSGWRLPTIKELQSLIDYGDYRPALPKEHPFTRVQSHYYWSSTTYAANTDYAWLVALDDGCVTIVFKAYPYYVWPVRDGKKARKA